MTYVIRPARLEDVPLLGPVETRAGQLFHDVGLGHLAGEFMVPEKAASFVRAGGAFVAADEADKPAGFLMAGPLEEAVYIYEVSVDPDHGRRGLGGRLLERAANYARERGMARLTLATFSDVPWNAPYYAKHGFEIVPRDAWSPCFHLLHESESNAGLPMERRCFMRKEL